MQVTETNTDGLKREFKVVVPAADLDARLNHRLVALKEFFPQAQGCLRRGTTVHPSGNLTIGEFHEERNKFLEEGQRLAQFQHTSIVKKFPLFDSQGEIYAIGGIVTDITEREREEAARRYSEERYRLVVETANDAIAATVRFRRYGPL